MFIKFYSRFSHESHLCASKKTIDSIEKGLADQGRFDFNLTTTSPVFHDAKIELRGQNLLSIRSQV